MLLIQDVEFSANTANNSGGALSVANGDVHLVSVRFHNNKAKVAGGLDLYNPFNESTSRLAASGVEFTGNVADSASHIYSQSKATISFDKSSTLQGFSLVDFEVATGGSVLFDRTSGITCDKGSALSMTVVPPYLSSPLP